MTGAPQTENRHGNGFWCILRERLDPQRQDEVLSRIAVISDIHSNWQALQTVWRAIVDAECDQVICLGDVVGYGARPAECLRFVREKGWTWIQGNHDALVGDRDLSLPFNPISLMAVEHNRDLLSPEEQRFLRELPWRQHPREGLFLAHGSYRDRDRYLLHHAHCQDEAGHLRQRHGGGGVCFFGHTHQPVISDDTGFRSLKEGAVRLDPNAMTLINPGSVGQPRDWDPRAAYAIWDTEVGTIDLQRLPYDVEAARREILDAGLPARLGDRLLQGR
ncbi:hypothetical protein CSB20_02595 [bacterium DOLZORAL124_64_63]|nr:MAG: hypothetical protein CSB20_02595 [bacterium DOLZORAL124_64_63]